MKNEFNNLLYDKHLYYKIFGMQILIMKSE